jgi:hypothetical protein
MDREKYFFLFTDNRLVRVAFGWKHSRKDRISNTVGSSHITKRLMLLNYSRIHVGTYLSFYGKTVRRKYFEHTSTFGG